MKFERNQSKSGWQMCSERGASSSTMLTKLIFWLALCGLLTSGRLAQSSEPLEPPRRLLGISFSSGAQSGAQNGAEERRQISENELRRALLQSDIELAERARAQHLAMREEIKRRARLNQILDAIGARLAPAQQLQQLQQQQQPQQPQPPVAPLHRSGRIYPSREPAASSDNFRNFNLRAPDQNGNALDSVGLRRERLRAADSVEQWEPSMLDGAAGSSKSQRSSGIKGLVWPSNRPIISGNSPPLYASSMLAGAANGPVGLAKQQHSSFAGADGGPQVSTIYGAKQQRARSGLLPAARAPHHRANTEEVAIQTPVHSRSQSDYEWKRVEQSRWNNLRGMWGKRAAMRDDEDPAQKYRELVEWEAAQAGSAQRGPLDQDADGSEQSPAATAAETVNLARAADESAASNHMQDQQEEQASQSM